MCSFIQILRIGKAWALLGCLRLQLTLPSRGLDPSGRASFKLHHIKQNLEHQITPELKARIKVQNVPGGWSESQPIDFLKNKYNVDTARVMKLKEKCVLRPTPSQYRQLQEELKRFMANLGEDIEDDIQKPKCGFMHTKDLFNFQCDLLQDQLHVSLALLTSLKNLE